MNYNLNRRLSKNTYKGETYEKAKKLTSLLFLFCCLCFCLILFPQTARAGSLTPTAQDNLNVRLRRTSDLIPVSGGYMRVFHQKILSALNITIMI